MKNKGFSLIELLVVIVTMGIILGISVFSYRSLFARSELEKAMNEVRAFYEGVNRKAVTQGYAYIIQLDRENDLVEYVNSTGARQDAIFFKDNLDLVFGGGEDVVRLIVYVDGFVRDEDDVRDFRVEDANTGKSINFYISPLGILEANLQ